MITIAVDSRPTYLPVSTQKIALFFGGLVRNGVSRSTKSCMFTTKSSTLIVNLNSDMPRVETPNHCDSLRFDFPVLEDAFDCEFIEMPDSIQNAKDFKKWILEMDFE